MSLKINYLLVNEVAKTRKSVNGTDQIVDASLVCEGGRAFNFTEKQLNHQCRINGIRVFDSRLQNLGSWNKLATILRGGSAEVESQPHKTGEEYITAEGEKKVYTKDWIEENIVSLNPRETVANQQALSALKAIEEDWKQKPLDLGGLGGIDGM